MATPQRRPPALAILGPTASGKTALALELHERLPVDIISVDSAQVYRGLDIGTAKPDRETLTRAPHRLVDIRDPAATYSGAEFIADARREMAASSASGRIPLLVGGTMLYFQLLCEGIAELPPADPAIRAELAATAAQHGWPHLHAELAQIDPETAARLHPRHSQRIQRALEICRVTGQPASRLLPKRQRPVAADYELRMIALVPADRRQLHHQIERRFAAMLDAGLLDEVRALHARGDLHGGLPALRTAGYRQAWSHLSGDCDEAEMAAAARAATRQLAKRQLTWLRNWRAPLQAQIDPFTAVHGGLAETLIRRLKLH